MSGPQMLVSCWISDSWTPCYILDVCPFLLAFSPNPQPFRWSRSNLRRLMRYSSAHSEFLISILCYSTWWSSLQYNVGPALPLIVLSVPARFSEGTSYLKWVIYSIPLLPDLSRDAATGFTYLQRLSWTQAALVFAIIIIRSNQNLFDWQCLWMSSRSSWAKRWDALLPCASPLSWSEQSLA